MNAMFMKYYVFGYMKAMRVQTLDRIRVDLDIKASDSNLGPALYALEHEGKITMTGSLVILGAEASDDPHQIEETEAH